MEKKITHKVSFHIEVPSLNNHPEFRKCSLEIHFYMKWSVYFLTLQNVCKAYLVKSTRKLLNKTTVTTVFAFRHDGVF